MIGITRFFGIISLSGLLGLACTPAESTTQPTDPEPTAAEDRVPGTTTPADRTPGSETPRDHAEGLDETPQDDPVAEPDDPSEPVDTPTEGNEDTPPADPEPEELDEPVEVPIGQNAETDEEPPAAGEIDDPQSEAKSGELDTPGEVDEPQGDTPDEWPAAGWAPSTPPAVWQPLNFAPYPHSLPEAPQKMAEGTLYRPWTSGRGLAVKGDELFVANTEHGSLVVLDRTSGDILRVINVGARPEQVVLAPDGTAYVTIRHGAAVAKVLPGASQVAQMAKVGTEPYGLALSEDGAVLYVTIAGENRLVALHADDLTLLSNVDVPRRPRSIKATATAVFVTLQFGQLLKVALGEDGALLEAVKMPLRTTNPADLALHQDVKTAPGIPTKVFGVDQNPANGKILVSHVEAFPGSTEQSVTELLDEEAEVETTCDTSCATQCKQQCKNSGGYGGVTCSNSCTQSCNTTCTDAIKTFPHLVKPIEVSMSAFDPVMGDDGTEDEVKAVATQASPPTMDPLTGEPMTALCDKPWDLAHHPEWGMAFVACKGTDNVLVASTHNGDPMRSIFAEIKVGMAPTAIAFDEKGDTAYVMNKQSFTISEIDLSPLFAMEQIAPQNAPAPGFGKANFATDQTLTKPVNLVHQAEVAYANDPFAGQETVQEGRRTFTFSRSPGLSANGFFACSTCHFEGTEDGLVWFVSDGPRQTPILAQKLKATEPFNWMGSAETLNVNIVNTVKRMGGSGLEEDQIQSIVDFLLTDEGLVQPPNPFLSPDGLNESQKAGQALFFHPAVGCANCHAGSGLTDGKNWDVGTFTDLEQKLHTQNNTEKLVLNTPSLSGLYYSAPYLHDGSAETLFDVLNMTSATMGNTLNLTGKQQEDLVNYLLTL